MFIGWSSFRALETSPDTLLLQHLVVLVVIGGFVSTKRKLIGYGFGCQS